MSRKVKFAKTHSNTVFVPGIGDVGQGGSLPPSNKTFTKYDMTAEANGIKLVVCLASKPNVVEEIVIPYGNIAHAVLMPEEPKAAEKPSKKDSAKES